MNQRGNLKPTRSTETWSPGRKFLFGIGIDKYPSTPLHNAVKDLNDIVTVLCDQYDFERENVTLLINEQATRSSILNTLHSYTSSSKLSANDSLLIYFSGHGYYDKNNADGYWIAIDSSPDDIASMIENVVVKTRISQMKCRHVLLISDSCFSGSLLSKGQYVAPKTSLAAELERKKSRWIITSGRFDETVLDATYSNRANSPFAAAMLSELKHNFNAKLLADDLAGKVRQITWSNASQVSQYERLQEAGDMGGRFVFSLRDPEPGAWELVQKENTVDSYIQFLTEYTASTHSKEARERIDSLQKQNDINPVKESERFRQLTPEELANELLNRRLIESILDDSQPLLSFRDWQTIKRHRSNIKDWGQNKLLKENLLDKSGKHWRLRIVIALILLYIGLGASTWWRSSYGQIWQMEQSLGPSSTSGSQVSKSWSVRALVVIGKHAQALSTVKSLNKENKASILPEIAQGFIQAKDTLQAKSTLTKALTASDSLSDFDKARSLPTIAQGFATLKDTNQAKSVLTKALVAAASDRLTEEYKANALLDIARKFAQLNNQIGLTQVVLAINELTYISRAGILPKIAQESILLTNISQARSSLEAALKASDSLSNFYKVPILLNITQGYANLKDADRAKVILSKALTATNNLLNRTKAILLPSVAQEFTRLKDTLQAKSVLKNALIASDSLSNEEKADMLPVIAQGFAQLKDTVQAKHIIETALTAAQSLSDSTKGKSRVLPKIAQGFAQLKDSLQASHVIKVALTTSGSLPDEDKARVLPDIAQGFYQLNETFLARSAIEKALTATKLQVDKDRSLTLPTIALKFATFGDWATVNHIISDEISEKEVKAKTLYCVLVICYTSNDAKLRDELLKKATDKKEGEANFLSVT